MPNVTLRKKLKNKNLIFLVLVVGLITYFFIQRSGEITVTNIKWECEWVKEQCVCNASFELFNNTLMDTNCIVNITALRKFGVEKTASVRVIGEEKIDLKLKARETKSVTKTFIAKAKPDFVKISATKAQNQY